MPTKIIDKGKATFRFNFARDTFFDLIIRDTQPASG